MSIAVVRNVLLWCTLINFGVLIVGFLAIAYWREPLSRLGVRWLGLPAEQYVAIGYASLVLYETLVFVFNLVPYIALLIAG